MGRTYRVIVLNSGVNFVETNWQK